MSQGYFIGIDIGTQGARVVMIDQFRSAGSRKRRSISFKRYIPRRAITGAVVGSLLSIDPGIGKK